MLLELAQVREWLGIPGATDDSEARGYSVDSRTLQPGDLFFALRGPRHDGHDYVHEVLRRGAVAAVVEDSRGLGTCASLLPVRDTSKALRTVAARARSLWGRPVIAVTGSSGKTTTKEATAALLGALLPVAKSHGNLNNEIGLPISLLRIPDAACVAVVEIGINHPGEMEDLARIASPDIAVVTNVGAAHVGNFSSVDEIAQEKGRLLGGLARGGTAVLNADDPRIGFFRGLHGGRTLTFGVERVADVRARNVQDRGLDGVSFELDGCPMVSPLPGLHNLYNVLAAMAAASAMGIAPSDLAQALSRLRPSPMRGVIRRAGGVVLIDDCYNASPAAVAAMLRVLRSTAASRRIAVLGEMRELGKRSRELHRRVGRAVSSEGVDYLVAVGGDAAEIAEAAAVPGLFCESASAAARILPDLVRPGDAVLFKASRGVGLERARDPLLKYLSGSGAVSRKRIVPAQAGSVEASCSINC